ncbi:MAG: hypothetical protein ACLQUY_07130 [Ktedonobacterales bacterium]
MSNPLLSPSPEQTAHLTHTWDIILFACLMILFGLAEMVTGFTHNFFGITTSSGSLVSYSSAAIGACYVLSGVLVLTLKRWAAVLAIVLLGVDVIGRVALVVTGLYPTNSLKNTFSIVAGTLIAVIFAIYIGWRQRSFS